MAESLEWQTVPPKAWIVVDNGSTDGGLNVAHELAARLPWARVLEIPGEGAPRPGAPIVRAFHAGLRELPRYLFLRTLQARQNPAALAMIPSCLGPALRREPRYRDAEVRRYLRERQGIRAALRRARSTDARA